MTPLKSVRQFCLRCTSGDKSEVRKCAGRLLGQGDKNGMCFFHPYRLGRGRPSVKTIRRSCLECCGGSTKLVRECRDANCPVWRFRMGRNPNRARIGGDARWLKQGEKGGLTVQLASEKGVPASGVLHNSAL